MEPCWGDRADFVAGGAPAELVRVELAAPAALALSVDYPAPVAAAARAWRWTVETGFGRTARTDTYSEAPALLWGQSIRVSVALVSGPAGALRAVAAPVSAARPELVALSTEQVFFAPGVPFAAVAAPPALASHALVAGSVAPPTGRYLIGQQLAAFVATFADLTPAPVLRGASVWNIGRTDNAPPETLTVIWLA